MAIKVTNGFEVRAKSPIDTRILLTKEEMAEINDKLMPQNYFCICNDNDEDKGKVYIYDKNAAASEETGKFRPFEEVMSMVQAITKAMSTPESAQEIAEAMFDSEHFQTTIDNKIDLAVSQIQAVDGNEEE